MLATPNTISSEISKTKIAEPIGVNSTLSGIQSGDKISNFLE